MGKLSQKLKHIIFSRSQRLYHNVADSQHVDPEYQVAFCDKQEFLHRAEQSLATQTIDMTGDNAIPVGSASIEMQEQFDSEGVTASYKYLISKDSRPVVRYERHGDMLGIADTDEIHFQPHVHRHDEIGNSGPSKPHPQPSIEDVFRTTSDLLDEEHG